MSTRGRLRTVVSIDVSAPPELVFRLARDPLRWSTLLPHYSRSSLISRGTDGSVLGSYVARRPLIAPLGIGFPVAWRSRAWSDPEACGLRFRHEGGATAGMEATWRIVPIDGGCRVTIEHVFAPGSRVVVSLLDRFFARPIAGRTLATFKALAEAAAGAEAGSVMESARSRATNQSP